MSIENKRKILDEKVEQTMAMKGKSFLIRKEQEDLKRQDRKKTVERIQRQNEFHKESLEDRSNQVNLPDEISESCQFIPFNKNRANKMARNAEQLND